MRRLLPYAAISLLAGPALLAFFSGGYFAEPTLIAGIVVWIAVLVLAVMGPSPWPGHPGGRVALAGLGLLTVWSAISLAWAPQGGPAGENVQRLVLYLGVLLAATSVSQLRPVASAAEPVLALGTVVVIGHGLAGHLLPGIVHLARSGGAGGRLEQPLTYWNAEGLLAAMGLVLCARLAGGLSRPVRIRALAAAACAPLGLGVYLSFSRGAIVAAVLGLAVVVAAAPSRSQLHASVLALVVGGLAALGGAVFSLVSAINLTDVSDRERDGALLLLVVVVLMVLGGAVQARRAAAEPRGETGTDRLPYAKRLPAVALAVFTLALAGLVAGGLGERGHKTALSSSASRLASVKSNRYEYWRVALAGFWQHPIEGLGSAGFRVAWLKHRSIRDGVLQAHSLELGTLSELGLPGLAFLLMMLGGIAAAARAALARHGAAAAGACGLLAAWVLHSGIDWDWEVPAVTLLALIMGGVLVSLASVPAQLAEEGGAR